MSIELNIALAQRNPIVGDIAGNADKIRKAWNDIPDDTDLIVFSEMIICGYPPEDLVLKPAFMDDVENNVYALAQESKNHSAAIILPTPWRLDGTLYNAAHLIHDGKIQATIAKHHLPNYGVFDEQRLFAAGPLPDPVDFKDTKLGLMICEDMWFPDVAAHLKDKGAEILIVPNGSPFDCEKRNARFEHAKSRIEETGLPLIYVNQAGGQDELVFDGGSFAMSADAILSVQAPSFFEALNYVEWKKEENNNFFATDAESAHPLSENEALYEALKLGLHDYVAKNNFPGVILGLSGGIDSALTATLAVDALGADKVRGVRLPSQYTSQDSLEDAEALANNLGIKLDTIPIEAPVESLNSLILNYVKLNERRKKASPVTEAALDITLQNIQPRTRGLILMALSNASGDMVLSTGNKSEIAVGYATLYGDMNGGFNALKDVYKTQVYNLSRWRNAQSPVIPERILTKAPTAELKENQTDQDSLPPYEELDVILHNAIELEKSAAEITALGYDAAIVQKTLAMLDRAEYKRRQACPGVKITTRAFGRDRRYPITNHFINKKP